MHITLYVSGSISAYKSAVLCRLLIKSGADVQVVLTAAAAQFVTPLTFQTLTQRPVLTDLFSATSEDPIKHISVADWSDIAIVAPASADLLAKMAHGLADDAASSTLLATVAPKFVAPAMNSHMWQNPATQRNVAQLRADGVHFIDPGVGFLAEGYSGSGRLAEPEAIVDALSDFIRTSGQQLLAGRTVLVSAGGTREAIDPVRYIGNRSSGKMGYALARAARALGAQVTLVTTAPLPDPSGIATVRVESAAQMQQEMTDRFATSDITLMAAAVADFAPAEIAKHKIKKQPDTTGLDLQLQKTPDILASLGKRKRSDQFLLGFAAETDDLLKNASAKLAAKGADMFAANDVSNPAIGFGSDNNRVTLLTKDEDPLQLETASKDDIALNILKQIAIKLREN